jgi:plasmid stabilization system protein ParE
MNRLDLDPIYFSSRTWARRIKDWIAQARAAGQATPFLDGNVAVMRQILTHPDTGPRMVVNIGADALLKFVETNDYKNIYDKPVVGGRRREPTKERIEVDRLLGLGAAASNSYFGAVALGGAGVRFYGEYCMVIKRSRVGGTTRLFDRDSYDLLQAPLAERGPTRTSRIVGALRGQWDKDLVDMLIMRALPRLPPTQHLITVGNVSGLIMSDQEFVEVHLVDKIGLEHIEEIRQLPEEAAIESSILSRRRDRQSPTLVEIRWVAQRRRVLRDLARKGLHFRIASLHGKGYQWN